MTVLPADWREEGGAGAARQQRGGQYACVHLRRGDFARSRATQVASPKWAGRQLAARPTKQELRQFGDGGVAIIDQIICSHARYFIGTRESTFTFRIQECRSFATGPPSK